MQPKDYDWLKFPPMTAGLTFLPPMTASLTIFLLHCKACCHWWEFQPIVITGGSCSGFSIIWQSVIGKISTTYCGWEYGLGVGFGRLFLCFSGGRGGGKGWWQLLIWIHLGFNIHNSAKLNFCFLCFTLRKKHLILILWFSLETGATAMNTEHHIRDRWEKLH